MKKIILIFAACFLVVASAFSQKALGSFNVCLTDGSPAWLPDGVNQCKVAYDVNDETLYCYDADLSTWSECIPDGIQITSVTFTPTTSILTITESNGDVYSVAIPASQITVTNNPDGSVTVTHLSGAGISSTWAIPAPHTYTSTDGSVTILQSGNNFDLSVEHPADSTVVVGSDNIQITEGPDNTFTASFQYDRDSICQFDCTDIQTLTSVNGLDSIVFTLFDGTVYSWVDTDTWFTSNILEDSIHVVYNGMGDEIDRDTIRLPGGAGSVSSFVAAGTPTSVTATHNNGDGNTFAMEAEEIPATTVGNPDTLVFTFGGVGLKVPLIGANNGVVRNGDLIQLGKPIRGPGYGELLNNRHQYLNGNYYEIGGTIHNNGLEPTLKLFDNGDATSGIPSVPAGSASNKNEFFAFDKDQASLVGGLNWNNYAGSPIEQSLLWGGQLRNMGTIANSLGVFRANPQNMGSINYSVFNLSGNGTDINEGTISKAFINADQLMHQPGALMRYGFYSYDRVETDGDIEYSFLNSKLSIIDDSDRVMGILFNYDYADTGNSVPTYKETRSSVLNVSNPDNVLFENVDESIFAGERIQSRDTRGALVLGNNINNRTGNSHVVILNGLGSLGSNNGLNSGSAFDIVNSTANKFIGAFPNGYELGTGTIGTGWNSSGVVIGAGGNAWASISEKAKKVDLGEIDYEQLLEDFDDIPVHTWRYKTDTSFRETIYVEQDILDDNGNIVGTEKVATQGLVKPLEDVVRTGLFAEDFHSLLGELSGDSTKIVTTDADGVNAALIKALLNRLKALEDRIEELEAKK